MTGNPDATPIETLTRQAKPRPDLTEGKPFTYMGRVATQPSSVAEMLSKVPVGEMESGGQGMSALTGLGAAGMAKQFKPASAMEQAMLKVMNEQRAAQPAVRTIGNKTFKDALPVTMAKPGATTDTPMEKMFAAMIDPRSGQVINTRTPYRAGDHGGLMTQAAAMDGFQGVRGFVDPLTMQAFTEAALEEILMKKHFGGGR